MAVYDLAGSPQHHHSSKVWAHARRGFVEAKQATPGKASKADEVLRLIAKLYRVEKDHKNATEQVRLHARQTESKALLEAIRQWLDTNLPIVVPSLKLGQAIAYLDKHWPRLVRYIERGDLPIGRVEMWRRYGRLGLICLPQLSRARCPNNSAVALFPHPSHQTGRADFPHPAFLETLAARHTQSTEVSSLIA